uniref:U26-Theriditoxin-Lha1b_1 n=1 Tax=Latrodectus hasselti TaxID=256736 RepID=A0A482ZHJ9_LATHA
MKIIVGIALVLMVGEVRGFFGGNRGNGRGGGGGLDDFRPLPPPFRHGHPPLSFPECEDFFQKIHDKLHENERNNERQSCRGKSKQECCYEKLVQARLEVQEQPTEACMNQVNDFLTGVPLSTVSPLLTSSVPESTPEE